MQNKCTVVFPENQAAAHPSIQQVLQMEVQAQRLMNAIARRAVVMSVFPNNRLNGAYRERNEQLLDAYGSLMAKASLMRQELGIEQVMLATTSQPVQEPDVIEVAA